MIKKVDLMIESWNRYRLTAAREHGKLGRDDRPSCRVIDIHSHVLVPEGEKIVAPYQALNVGPMAIFSNDETRAINKRQDNDRRSRMLDYAERLTDLDAMGIDLQVVMPPPYQCYYNLPDDVALEATRAVNEGIAKYIAPHLERFCGLGSVPLQNGEMAARELEHCITKLGLKGVQTLTVVQNRELSDPSFDPFWAAAERLNALILIHPNGFTGGDRLSEYYLNNIAGNPFETAVALHHLIFGGVLERFPDLKILAAHGGGYLASYSGRIDHAWGTRSDAKGKLKRLPSEYLRKIHVDSVVFTTHQLEHLVNVFGYDKIVMGTDYPYDMGEYDPVGHVVSTPLSDIARQAILSGNAKRLLLG